LNAPVQCGQALFAVHDSLPRKGAENIRRRKPPRESR
jgi:hypothetical protein